MPPNNEVHNTSCDGCDKDPIRGVRHRCLVCSNFNFCSTCFGDPQVHMIHGETHPLFPIAHAQDEYDAYKDARGLLKNRLVASPPVSGTPRSDSSSSDISSTSTMHPADDGHLTRLIAPNRHTDVQSGQTDTLSAETPTTEDATNPTQNPSSPTPRPGGSYLPPLTCGGCFSRIASVAHKCLDCDNFHFCTRCISDAETRLSHVPDHSFTPLDVSGDEHPPESTPAGQDGVVCFSCRRSIDDVQHRCIECAHFTLCRKCVSSVRIRELHDVSHHIFPADIASGDGLFAVISQKIHRLTSQCQGCRGANINLRQCYRCLSCPNFAFCNNCIGDPTIRFEHDVSHCFSPLALPEGRLNPIGPQPYGPEMITAVTGPGMVLESLSSLSRVSRSAALASHSISEPALWLSRQLS